MTVRQFRCHPSANPYFYMKAETKELTKLPHYIVTLTRHDIAKHQLCFTQPTGFAADIVNIINATVTSQCALWPMKSPATRLFVETQVNIKDNIKACVTGL